MVSVIIPAFNSEMFLGDCLNSLLQQTFIDYEVIFVNDGSSDGTREIALSYKNRFPKFKYIELDNNMGPGKSRNIGLDLSNGDYIFFLDSDDRIAPKTIESLRKFLILNNCDIVQCDICFDYGKFGLCKKPSSKELHYRVINRLEAMGLLIQQNLIKNFAWGKLYRKEIIKNVRFPDMICFEDFEWMQNVLLNCNRYGCFKEPLYFYRQHTNSLSSCNDQKQFIYAMSQRDLFIRKYFPDLLDEFRRYRSVYYPENNGQKIKSYLNITFKKIKERIIYPYEKIKIPF